jgi:hypothetical protein
MRTLSNHERINLSNAKAFRKARIGEILSSLGISEAEFAKAKKGRPIRPKKREKLFTETSLRRSHKKVITKEVQFLSTLRKMKGICQNHAFSVCSYSRPSIGHIENGRIELNRDRIFQIVNSYGLDLREFERLVNEDTLRDELLESCQPKMITLDENKLRPIYNLPQSF